MIDKDMQNYVGWDVRSVMKFRGVYGFRIVLKYADGSQRVQQKSGFSTKREAEKARDATVASLYNNTYVVYSKVKVADFLESWLGEFANNTDSYHTYNTFKGIVKNHINPAIGRKNITEVNAGDIQQLYKDRTEYSVAVARLVKTVVNISFDYAVSKKIIPKNIAEGIGLPKVPKSEGYHVRKIDVEKTLNAEQIELLIDKAKDTKIYIMILLNVLMGLRRSEIIAVKYSDVDFVNQTLSVTRQLGKKLGTPSEELAPKTITKQEIDVKTESSHRVLPIPDIVFQAIMEERQKYEKNRNRRKKTFQDLDYIVCSTYGRPRCSTFHTKHYKQLLKDCNLPNIRWHDLRATYCTLLLANEFSPKAVSKLMGHAKEIISIDIYGDNKNIIADCIPEITDFLEEVLPQKEEVILDREELLDIVIDTSEYIA